MGLQAQTWPWPSLPVPPSRDGCDSCCLMLGCRTGGPPAVPSKLCYPVMRCKVKESCCWPQRERLLYISRTSKQAKCLSCSI